VAEGPNNSPTVVTCTGWMQLHLPDTAGDN